MTRSRRHALHAGLLALVTPALASLAGGLAALPARAQAPWPQRPIRLVLPFAAGGGSDALTRILAEALTPLLGQRVLVENITGAGGTIGTERVARADPDGHVLLLATNNLVTINPALYQGLTFDIPGGLAPVGLLWETAHVVVARPALPARSLAELRDMALARPRSLSFASGGTGTTTHLYGELFRHLTGADITHVAYRGNGPAIADVIAGHVDLMFDQIPNSAEHLRVGRVRALAVTTPGRHPALPEVPTAAEAGFPEMEGTSWAGMNAPRGTDPAILRRLNTAAGEALRDPAVVARIEALGAAPRSSTPEAYAALVASDLERWTRVIRAAGITANP